jgi:hypothetical protein
MDTRRGYNVRMMRTLTTLLLVCFAWSQAAAANCSRADVPAGEQADVQAGASHAHHGHHAPAPAPSNDDGERHPPAPAHHASGCGVLMSCGAAATPPAAAGIAAHFADAAHGARADRDRYASPTLSTEPPPPRIALRS